ncbi:uncharacterized protein LOC130015396 [Mercurialis annua]|uniref:uncharacterized protein LOC130015396 n=1 Tax=Mercurialis annua TaxID=3986 RepID=UPI0024AF751F|nr:uncharacterized protein LOC130015396 [Mercurialis annua]
MSSNRKVAAVREFPVGCGRDVCNSWVQSEVVKVYPSRKRISALRDFPEGCGRQTSQVSLETDAMDHIILNVEKDLLRKQGEINRNKENRKNVSSTRHMSQLDYLSSEIAKKKVHEYDKIGKIAGQNRRNTSHEIVQALMAAPNCPWSQGKRVYKSMKASNRFKSTSMKHLSTQVHQKKSILKHFI